MQTSEKGLQITTDQIRKISPFVSEKAANLFLPYINKHAARFEVNTPMRMAAFIAQLLHESGSLNYVREIASGKAYEGRKDLGNTMQGDGVRFKGRGLIQITGRANYRALSKYLYNDENVLQNTPDNLATPELAVVSAYWFWHVYKNLNPLADKGEFKEITKKINGGLNGWAYRIKYYEAAKKVLM